MDALGPTSCSKHSNGLYTGTFEHSSGGDLNLIRHVAQLGNAFMEMRSDVARAHKSSNLVVMSTTSVVENSDGKA